MPVDSQPLVLMYHSIEPYRTDPFNITVRPERFEQQMRWLRRQGLRGASMREVREHPTHTRLVGLTFDDGYIDFVTHALPVLVRYGFTATVFVVADGLGRHNWWDEPGPRKRLMSASDVWRSVAAGMEIGSHSLSHQRLRDVDDRVLAEEVGRSRTVLEDLTGQPVTGFCYPYGSVGEREMVAVRDAGYAYACAVRAPGLAGPHAVQRTYIGDRDNPPRLLAKMLRHRLLRHNLLRHNLLRHHVLRHNLLGHRTGVGR